MERATIDTSGMPDETRLPGHGMTLGEQRETLRRMRALNEQFYWKLNHAEMGSLCHAFVEFCGLQSKFIDLCELALRDGREFSHLNTHSGESLGFDAHHAAYLGEKFRCIYGFAIGPDPELRAVFLEHGLGPERGPVAPSVARGTGYENADEKRAAVRRVLALAERERLAPGGHGTATLFDLHAQFAAALVVDVPLDDAQTGGQR